MKPEFFITRNPERIVLLCASDFLALAGQDAVECAKKRPLLGKRPSAPSMSGHFGLGFEV